MLFLKRVILVICLVTVSYPGMTCVNNEEAQKKCELDCCYRYFKDSLPWVACDLGCERCVMLR